MPNIGTDSPALGIVPRAARELIEKARVRHGKSCVTTCSHVKIYMEQAYDLLDLRTLPQERSGAGGGGRLGTGPSRGGGTRAAPAAAELGKWEGTVYQGCGCVAKRGATSTWRV